MATRDISVTRISPVSAFRVGLALSLIGLVAWLIAVSLLYMGMSAAGVWTKVNSLLGDLGGEQAVSFGLVLSFATLLGAVSAVLTTVLAPLGAVVYNAVVELFDGLRISIREEAS